MSTELRVSPASLREAIRTALLRAGVPDFIARVEGEVMAEADWMGVPSHGIRMLPLLVRSLHQGRANPHPSVALGRDMQATCLLDGDNGPGRYVSVQAMGQAVSRARKYGIGACLALHTTHWGRAHAYACRAAGEGFVGICTTNAIPNMLAWNSTRPLLGNNPLAIAFPRGRSREPVVLDLAMSQAAVGKVGTAAREGRQVPEGWGLDEDGHPTKDPARILASRKLLPFGEHKGAGLALMMELLTAGLSGGRFSHEIAAQGDAGLDANATKLFIALDPECFLPPDLREDRLEDFLACLCAAEPDLSLSLPGERGWRTRERYSVEGIPIHKDIVMELKKIEVDLEEQNG